MARPVLTSFRRSVVFVVPRFHTNLFFATQALVEAGYSVGMIVRESHAIEDHRFVRPVKLGPSPSRRAVAEVLEGMAPDLIFLRQCGGLSRQVARVARRRRWRMLGYDQKPLTALRTPRKIMSLRLRGLPVQRVTPVPGLDPAAPRDPQAQFLPWPVEPTREAAARARDMDGRLRVLCVGKLAQPRKNQHRVIAALEALGGADVARLTLAGSSFTGATGADPAHKEALVDAARRHDWIDLHADLAFQDMHGLYSRHHVCVLPSVGEPLGSAPLEGMAYGTIPVISKSAGSAGYLVPGETGLLVDMAEDRGLEKVLAPLVRDVALRERLSAAAQGYARRDLSPKRFVARVDALF